MMAAEVVPRPGQTIAPRPAFAVPAPTGPPTSAWELLDGMPASQVSTFHTMAPISAPNTTWASMAPASTMPVPRVATTLRSNTRNATKLNAAAQNTA